MEQFNYCIGYYWSPDSKQLGTYTYFGVVHYGTMKDAEGMLEYVKGRGGKYDYQIFKVVPLDA